MNCLTLKPSRSVTLPLRGSRLGGGEMADRLTDISPDTFHKKVSKLLATRLNVIRHVIDALADSQDKQK